MPAKSRQRRTVVVKGKKYSRPRQCRDTSPGRRRAPGRGRNAGVSKPRMTTTTAMVSSHFSMVDGHPGPGFVSGKFRECRSLQRKASSLRISGVDVSTDGIIIQAGCRQGELPNGREAAFNHETMMQADALDHNGRNILIPLTLNTGPWPGNSQPCDEAAGQFAGKMPA